MHKLRNLGKYIKNKRARRGEMYQDASAVYEAEGYMDAIDRIEGFIHKWQLKEPKAVKNFIANIDDTLRFFGFDKNLWGFLKSTNPLESYLSEIRSRVSLVDSFRDERSCEALIFALPKAGIQQPTENDTLIHKKQIYTIYLTHPPKKKT